MLLPTTSAPSPWCDPVRDWPVLLRPLSAWTRDALSAHPLTATDDLLVTPEFVDAFLATGRPFAALGPSRQADRGRALSTLPRGPEGSVRLPLARGDFPDAASLLAAVAAAPDGAFGIVPAEELSREAPAPHPYSDPETPGAITFSATRRIGLHATHRSHLLQANLDLLGATFARAAHGPKLPVALRYLRDRAFSRPLLSRVGRGAKVHRTAIVEGCQLGDHVEIGAFAIVRGVVLGDFACVEDGAHVQLSVLGRKARVARLTSVFLSLLQDGAHSAQSVMQGSVLGRRSAAATSSWFLDTRIGEVAPGPSGLPPRTVPVRVPAQDGGAPIPSGSRLLGCDAGHDVFVGAGVLIAAGRSIDSGLAVLADPTHVVSRTEVGAPAGSIVFARDGRLLAHRGDPPSDLDRSRIAKDP